MARAAAGIRDERPDRGRTTQLMKDVFMRARHAQHSDDELAKVVVFNALLRLVENGLAVWRRNAGDELELQVVSGEVFALGDTGITRVRPPCKRTCLCMTRRRRTA